MTDRYRIVMNTYLTSLIVVVLGLGVALFAIEAGNQDACWDRHGTFAAGVCYEESSHSGDLR